MPKQRKIGYTTIGIPIYLRDKLRRYGSFGDTWTDLLENLMNEVEEARKIKERYRLS